MSKEKDSIVIVFPSFGSRTLDDGWNTDRPEDIVRYIFFGIVDDYGTLSGIGYDWGGNSSGCVDSYFFRDEVEDFLDEDLENKCFSIAEKYITFETDDDGDGLFLLATKELKGAFAHESDDEVLVFTNTNANLEELQIPEFGLSSITINNDAKVNPL